MWRRQLNLDALYDDLKGELDAAMKVVQTDDETERAERSMHLGQTANALALLAAFGVVASIVTGVLSVNFLLTTDLVGQFLGAVARTMLEEKSGPGLSVAGHFAVFFAVLSLSSFFGCRMLTFVVPELKDGRRVGQIGTESTDGLGTPQLARFHGILMGVGTVTLVAAVFAIIMVFCAP